MCFTGEKIVQFDCIIIVLVLPKNYDATASPDPERWLPLRERSYYRGKRKNKRGNIGKFIVAHRRIVFISYENLLAILSVGRNDTSLGMCK